MATDLHIVTIDQQDPRLGRNVVHDPRSRGYAYPLTTVDFPTRDIRHVIYGPHPTPTQKVGCCTCADQVIKCDAVGNRIKGVVLGMPEAENLYALATTLDDSTDTQWPPDDTGTSGLAACKAAQRTGYITRYEWLFNGARQVLATLAGGEGKPGRCVGVGAWWYDPMFTPDPESLIVKPSGARVGGHQWTVTGWSTHHHAFEGLCWWGPEFGANGRFRIGFEDLDALLADNGDAHITYRSTQ